MYDYEAFYKKYPVNVHDEPARHGFVASLCRGRVRDIGCGTGTLSDYYLGEYCGHDISNEGIEQAKKIRRSDAHFGVLDCNFPTGLTFASDDTVVMCEFLEHLENDDWLFQRLKETARVGTRLIVSVPNGNACDCEEHVRHFNLSDLRKKFAPLGDLKFYNYPGIKYQYILTVEIGRLQTERPALVMVVKNEEKGLENAIFSAIEHVNEIVVAVDNSSSDKTLEISKKYADVLVDFDWSDNFAAARNFADDFATTEWRFFLDGHEYLEKCEWPFKYTDTPCDGFMCPIQMENGMMFANPRLYRRGVKFEGAVHEKQQCKKLGNAKGVLIKHDRLCSQSEKAAAIREQQRDDMMPRIMGRQVKDNPKNLRALFHLSMWAGAKKRFREALKWSKKYLAVSECAAERWFVRFNMALYHNSLGHGFRAFWQANLAEEETPGRWETQKLKGLILAQNKKWEDAVECLILSHQQNVDNGSYMPWVRDSAGTWNLIADCYFHLREYEKAALAWDAAGLQIKDAVAKDIFSKRAALMREMAIAQARQV